MSELGFKSEVRKRRNMKRSVLSLIALAAVLALALATSIPAVADAAGDYKAKCQVCHGPDGKGSAAGQKLGAKDFHSPEVTKMSDAEMIKITKEGSTNKKMPAFGGKLTDDQIKALVTYIRSLK
jgi:mono/diheme cytochrome c family protein